MPRAELFLWHAVSAAEIALISDRYAQIAQRTPAGIKNPAALFTDRPRYRNRQRQDFGPTLIGIRRNRCNGNDGFRHDGDRFFKNKAAF